MNNNEQIKRYLLGDLPEDEAEWLVEQCCTDEELSEALRTAENDLIDAYVCQELSEQQRRQFETHFLEPERRVAVDVARMLMNPEVRGKVSLGPIVEERSASNRWSVFVTARAGLVPAAVAGVVAAAYFWVQNHRLHEDLISARSAQTALQSQVNSLQRQNAQSHVPVPAEGEPLHPPAATTSLMLSSALLRKPGSHSTPVMTLSPATASVVLMLTLEPSGTAPAKSARYDVVLQTVEGRTIKTLRGLTSRHAPGGGSLVRARFPVQLLKEGDYIVTLVGRTAGDERKDIASYSFSVAR